MEGDTLKQLAMWGVVIKYIGLAIYHYSDVNFTKVLPKFLGNSCL